MKYCGKAIYRKIQILDDNGVTQFSTLEFDFDPSFEQLYVNSLIVRNADGEVLAEGELNTYYITNSETGYEASTERTVNLPVPSLAPGVDHRGDRDQAHLRRRRHVPARNAVLVGRPAD